MKDKKKVFYVRKITSSLLFAMDNGMIKSFILFAMIMESHRNDS